MPVIASNIEGLADIVNHDVNGFLVKPGDESTLAKYLLKLLIDEKERIRLAFNARRRALTNFDWKIIGEKVAEVYDQTIKQRSF